MRRAVGYVRKTEEGKVETCGKRILARSDETHLDRAAPCRVELRVVRGVHDLRRHVGHVLQVRDGPELAHIQYAAFENLHPAAFVVVRFNERAVVSGGGGFRVIDES